MECDGRNGKQGNYESDGNAVEDACSGWWHRGLAGVAVAGAEEPTPARVIVAGKGVTGTGKRADPFVFDSSTTKCVLRLMGAGGDVQWDLEDSPTDAEVIGGACWCFRCRNRVTMWCGPRGLMAEQSPVSDQGANGPPPPVDEIVRRVGCVFGPDAKGGFHHISSCL